MKTSLRTMLIWVAFAAVVAAALARPSLMWTRLLFTAAVMFLGWSLIGALTTRRGQRAFWIGAATTGLVYGLLFTGGRQSPYGGDTGFELGRALVTHQVLDWTAHAIGHEDPMEGSRATVWDPMIFWQTPVTPGPLPLPPPVAWQSPITIQTAYDPAVYSDPSEPGLPLTLPEVPQTTYTTPALTPPPPLTTVPVYPVTPPTISLTPYTAQSTYSQFLLCGHCAFLIVLGAIGGALARWKFGGEE